MIDDAWTVVKVGGSLFDLPDLRARLGAFLASLNANRVLLVPGGGATADVVREFDRVHRLGDEASHWLAIAALSVNARFLQALLPNARIGADFSERMADLCVLDALPFFLADEAQPDHLPHSWQVTSDSLAARVAKRLEARELVLLKSIDWQSDDWTQACQAGVVDGYFAEAIAQARPGLSVRVVNLRSP